MKTKTDRTVECMVCGKQFPRGPLDMARHQTAITLKHVVSEKKSPAFPFGCKKCSIHFTSEEHLEMHKKYSSCNPKPIVKIKKPVVQMVKPVPQNSIVDKNKPDKTCECMVCGKLFARGALDLLRHTTAVTLKHVFTHKKSKEFKFQCDKCELLFTSEDHLISHGLQTSCNALVAKEIGRPEYFGTNAELEAKYLAEKMALAEEEEVEEGEDDDNDDGNDESDEVSQNEEHSTSSSNSQIHGGNGEEIGLEESNNPMDVDGNENRVNQVDHDAQLEEGAAHPNFEPTSSSLSSSLTTSTSSVIRKSPRELQRSTRHTPPSTTALASSGTGSSVPFSSPSSSSSTAAPAAMHQLGGNSEGGIIIEGSAASKKRNFTMAELLESRKLERKRAKCIYPEERKLFFSLISLLVCPALIAAAVTDPTANEPFKLTEENFEQFVPPDKLAAVDKLKGILRYDC